MPHTPDSRTQPFRLRRRKPLPFAQVATAVALNPAIPPDAKALYLVLASLVDLRDRSDVLTFGEIGVHLGRSADAVERYAIKLEAAGILRRTPVQSEGTRAWAGSVWELLDHDLGVPDLSGTTPTRGSAGGGRSAPGGGSAPTSPDLGADPLPGGVSIRPQGGGRSAVPNRKRGREVVEVRSGGPDASAGPVDAFEAWWQVYPRRDHKAQARRQWERILRSGQATRDQLRAAAAAYRDLPGRSPDHTMMAKTFLGVDGPWPEYLPGADRPAVEAPPAEQDRILAAARGGDVVWR